MEIRLYAGDSQQAFGKRLGIGRSSVIRYEKGERKIDAEVLFKLNMMGFDVNWLLTGLGKMLEYEDAAKLMHGIDTDEYMEDIKLHRIQQLEQKNAELRATLKKIRADIEEVDEDRPRRTGTNDISGELEPGV